MGTTDIANTKSNGTVIDADDINDLRGSLVGDFVGRDGSSKAVASGQRLGTPTFPWGNAYVGSLIVNGQQVDFDSLLGVAIPNTIISGSTRSGSQMSDFIRAAGSSPQFTLLATTTNLLLNIDSTATSFTADVSVGSLTTAPASNNTCLVNQPTFSDQPITKEAGTNGKTLMIDTAGSEITDRVGQYVTFKAASEYMLAYVKSSTELTNIYRGFYFDDSGDPIVAEVLSNNDTLTIMSTAWIFAENNGTTVDVTYNSPIYDYTEPSSPSTGDYWFDMQNETWKRYSGADFIVINRILVGVAVIDSTNCVAARSFNFDKNIYNFNPLSLKYISATQVSTVETDFNIGVYGGLVVNRKTPFLFDITTDLESGFTEASSTTYYAYITEKGQARLSPLIPYNQKGDLGGWYHPYESWRCLGYITNDSSGDFDSSTLRPSLDIESDEIITIDFSAQSSVPIIDLAPYRKVEFEFQDVSFSNNAISFRARTSTDNGLTFDSGSGDYRYALTRIDGAAASSVLGSNSDSLMRLTSGDVGNSNSSKRLSGKVIINNPNLQTPCAVSADLTYVSSANFITNYSGSADRSATGAVNAIQFFPDSGTMTGRVIVRGIK